MYKLISLVDRVLHYNIYDIVAREMGYRLGPAMDGPFWRKMFKSKRCIYKVFFIFENI